MGSPSGDGGSGDQAAEQARIRSEQDKAIAELNALFGVDSSGGSPSYMQVAATPGEARDYALDPKNIYSGAPTPDKYQAAIVPGNGVKTINGVDYYPDGTARNSAAGLHRAEAEANKAKREASYRTLGNDVMAARMPQLDKQREQAARLLKDQLARTGQVGGSLALDQGAEITDNYGRGVLDMENQKEAAINTGRAQDEQTRIDLITRIRAGMDQGSALASAASQTQSNIAQTRDSALAQNMQDYFSGMGYLYGQNQQQNAYQQRMKQLGVSGPSASNGTVSATGG